jgi:hypothetical protein
MSMDVPTQGKNAHSLYRFRESLLPYLLPAKGDAARATQVKKWERNLQAGEAYARAHVLFLRGRHETPEFQGILAEMDREYPDYSPLKFLKGEVQDLVAMTPALIRAENIILTEKSGNRVNVEISAVKVPIGNRRAAVIFVNNRVREIFGQRYFDGEPGELDATIQQFVNDVFAVLAASTTMDSAREAIDRKVRQDPAVSR